MGTVQDRNKLGTRSWLFGGPVRKTIGPRNNSREAIYPGFGKWHKQIIGKIKKEIAIEVKRMYNSKVKLDCADVAITALINVSAKNSLPLKFEDYKSSRIKYFSIPKEDKKVKAFVKTIKGKLAAIHLIKYYTKDISTLNPSDMVLYDLTSLKSDAFTGHTRIITGIRDGGKYEIIEGGLDKVIEKKIRSEKDLKELFAKYKIFPYYREWAWDQIYPYIHLFYEKIKNVEKKEVN